MKTGKHDLAPAVVLEGDLSLDLQTRRDVPAVDRGRAPGEDRVHTAPLQGDRLLGTLSRGASGERGDVVLLLGGREGDDHVGTGGSADVEHALRRGRVEGE